MPTNTFAMQKMVSNILGISLTVALGIVLVTSVTASSICAAANTTKAAASNATAANTTKAAASNANSASPSNPISKIGQAIVNGLKGLGKLITGSKK